MAFLLNPRVWFLAVALACGGLLGYALYIQHVDFLDPCPLCVFQRMVFMWIGAVSLLAALHGPGNAGRWLYGTLVLAGGATGLGVAGRHLWLQSLPADQVPDCGMGLNYMLETMPFTEVLSEVFYGSGECAEVIWSFLGLSMPGWTFTWYALISLGTLFILIRSSRTKG